MKLFALMFTLLLFSCSKKPDLEKEGAQDSKENSAASSSIVEENDQCICPKDFRPVCGENGQTYPNACQAGCDGVESFTEGSCDEELSEEELREEEESREDAEELSEEELGQEEELSEEELNQ